MTAMDMYRDHPMDRCGHKGRPDQDVPRGRSRFLSGFQLEIAHLGMDKGSAPLPLSF